MFPLDHKVGKLAERILSIKKLHTNFFILFFNDNSRATAIKVHRHRIQFITLFFNIFKYSNALMAVCFTRVQPYTIVVNKTQDLFMIKHKI